MKIGRARTGPHGRPPCLEPENAEEFPVAEFADGAEDSVEGVVDGEAYEGAVCGVGFDGF